jgi:deoxyhypusine synthase
MLEDDVTIFLGMAGALSAGGLRLIVAHLIANRYVDCLVSTGANLYHDLHETRGQHHFLASPHADDAALADEQIDRVYDTLASEEEFIENDNWIADFAATLEPRAYTTREFLYQLGGHLWTTTQSDGILVAAYRANVPIFCPAIADSSIGMGLSQARQESRPEQIDIIGDIVGRRTSSSAGRGPRPSSWAAAPRRTSSTRPACRPSSTARRWAATGTRCKS